MNSKLDEHIKILFNKKTENTALSDDLLNSIKIGIEERGNNMKRFKFTPRTFAVAAALTVILATGAIAAGKAASISSHSDLREKINHFPSVEEIKSQVDYVPKYTEKLGAYEFDSAQPSKSQDNDENGNVLSSYKDISFYYKTDKGSLSLHTTPAIREEDKTDDVINYKGISLYYSSYTYKAVPPDYEKTQEDIERENSGELSIGYGASEISEEKLQSVIWVENGITYDLLDMGVEIDKNDFIAMAQQVINS